MKVPFIIPDVVATVDYKEEMIARLRAGWSLVLGIPPETIPSDLLDDAITLALQAFRTEDSFRRTWIKELDIQET